ncbi:MAG: 6-carboxytetrahydropterin synthase [bacterium]
MKIAKEFRWEMGHRLTFHKGKCRNLHGHSYKMLLELEGDIESNGMVMDYYDVKKIIDPIIENLDHSFVVKRDDGDLIDALNKLNSKYVVVDFESTAENLCIYMINEIKNQDLPKNIKRIMIRLFETENTFAEAEIILQDR